MDADRFGSRSDRSEERYQAGSPLRESTEGAFDDSEEHDKDKSRELTKHRSKDKKKSRREDKDHRSRDRDHSKLKDDLKEKEKDFEKERIPIKEKRKEEKEEHEKDRTKDKSRVKDNDRDKHKGKDHDRDREEKDRGRKKDRERERDNDQDNNRGREKDRGKEKTKEKEEREKEKTKDKDRGKDKEREKDKERTRDRERDHEKNKDRDFLDREQAKDISREREREMDNEKERSRDKEKVGRRNREDLDHSKDGGRETKAKKDGDDNRERETSRLGNASRDEEAAGPPKQGDYVADSLVDPNQSRMEVAQRILRMKEERLKKTPEGTSEILSWVHKSRKLGEKRNSEKEKALRRSKIFEEQDNLDEDDNEVDNRVEENADSLAGVKVLHGIDKVLEGGSVVLTLKDQNILANGDLNEDVDMLENAEIGEQKRRGEAYKAAKKSSGIYVDKFNDEHGEEKKMLPQYDDPAEEEGVVLDAAGRFAGEAEKKLEELRRRLQGPVKNQAEDLNASARISSDYFTPEEMLQFRKPKKKKSLRKKDKLDLDALEAEARSTGLGATDLGSRNDSKRQAAKEEEERNEAERRKSAYQAAFSKADEASRALRMEQVVTPAEENDTLVFADDAEDLQKSLERTRKLALKKLNEKTLTGPEAVARLASVTTNNHATDAQNSTPGDASDNKVVFTEMEEFVWGLQLDEETQKPYDEDVFMEEDEMPPAFEEKKDETGGWTEVADSGNDEQPKSEDEEDVVPDKTLHEVPVGKGLSGVLKLLKDRGTLKETIEWGGRNMDKKKSKLVGIHEDDGPSQIRMDKKKGKLVDEVPREINLERLDEFGRVLTPKQAFRLLSHKFHGKGPGKMKQEKRMKQYHDELKQKQMTSSDMFPQSVEKMREAQAQLKTPYLVLSGHVKPGQTSDPRSGFATVEKEVPGSLTPMLGDKKVEHFLGIKRKAESGSSGTPKKPKH